MASMRWPPSTRRWNCTTWSRSRPGPRRRRLAAYLERQPRPHRRAQHGLEDGCAGPGGPGHHRRGGDSYRKAPAGAGRAGRGFGQCRGGAGGAGSGVGDRDSSWSPTLRARRSKDGPAHCEIDRLRAGSPQAGCPIVLGSEKGGRRTPVSRLAAQVGSDVPLFLIGGTVLGLDRGQQVYPLPDLEPLWCVVAMPEVGVSTPQAFRDWDALCAAEGLTAEASTDKLKELSRAYASAFAGSDPGRWAGSRLLRCPRQIGARTWPDPKSPRLSAPGSRAGFENDFERVVFPQHPSLAEIKRILLGFGHSGGSPPCLAVRLRFGALRVVPDPRRCGSGAGTVERAVPKPGSAEHLTRTLPRAAYWREMLLQEAG